MVSFLEQGWQITRVRQRQFGERIRTSFFFLPTLGVLGAVLFAALLLTIDGRGHTAALPLVLQTTVASARALVSTIAGALITVTGLVFSLSIVAIQLAASQYSPRIVRILFRSRFQQAIMGYMVGTFSYCLIVLRALRAPLGDNGEAILPSLALTVAFILGIGAALAMLAYVDYIARSIQIGNLIAQITAETKATIFRIQPQRAETPRAHHGGEPAADVAVYHITAARSGWVQQATATALLAALPPHTTLQLAVGVGQFVVADQPLGALWPVPANPTHIKRLLQQSIQVGPTRTQQEDVLFGIRQLVDIAVRALSPGINDPTTAIEVIKHLGVVQALLIARDVPAMMQQGKDGRWLLRPQAVDASGYVHAMFDQVRIAGQAYPVIAIALFETVGQGIAAAHTQNTQYIAPLQQQADAILAGVATTSWLPVDRARVHQAAQAVGF